HEELLAALRGDLRRVAAEAEALSIGLEQDRADLARYLAALQKLGNAPKSAMLAYPGGPVKAARAATLIGHVTPELEARMRGLQTRLAEISAVRSQQDGLRDRALTALGRLQDLRARANRALRDRSFRVGREEITRRAERAGETAADIAELSANLGRILTASPPPIPFEATRGTLPLPVAGEVTSRFGNEAAGRRQFGITLTAPAFAQVTAPAGGTIRYTGELIGFGQVVVLEPEAGWLMVLSGLQDIARTTGETVLQGEPIGSMGGPIPTSEEFLLEAEAQSGQIGVETLYIELRRDDEAVDPGPWFARD
ncbi:MAG: peptidoglycan DD-metalloendopeptidase family protein, partial [Pseudomonadota bacterium]